MKRSNNGERSRVMGAVAVSAVLLVPLAVFGAPALAGSSKAAASEYQYGSGSAQYQYRVTICHLTGSKKHPAHTITVSSAAVRAHLRHGDHLGACTGSETRRAKHGNDAKHGKGHDANSGSTTNTGHGDDHAGAQHGKGHGK